MSVTLRLSDSSGPVPVIPFPQTIRAAHAERVARTGYIFAVEKKRFALDSVAGHVIRPTTGCAWKGWRGFRRGLATNNTSSTCSLRPFGQFYGTHGLKQHSIIMLFWKDEGRRCSVAASWKCNRETCSKNAARVGVGRRKAEVAQW
jgi:hypothetical protein